MLVSFIINRKRIIKLNSSKNSDNHHKIAIFFEGTWVNKDGESHFFSMVNTPPHGSIVAQLYHDSLLSTEHKFYFPGPGTAHKQTISSQLRENLIAAIYGGWGEHGIDHSVTVAYQAIEQYLLDLPHDQKLDLQLTGWSRGGFACLLLLCALITKLDKSLQEKIANIISFAIDPVPGGWFDRFNKVTQLKLLTDAKYSRLVNKIDSISYYSDSGNLNLIKTLSSNYLSTPFFNPVIDPNKNQQMFVFQATHQGMAGRYDSLSRKSKGKEKNVALLIKQHIKAVAQQKLAMPYQHHMSDFSANINYPNHLTIPKKFYKRHVLITGKHNMISRCINKRLIDRFKTPYDCLIATLIATLKNDGLCIKETELVNLVALKRYGYSRFLIHYLGKSVCQVNHYSQIVDPDFDDICLVINHLGDD